MGSFNPFTGTGTSAVTSTNPSARRSVLVVIRLCRGGRVAPCAPPDASSDPLPCSHVEVITDRTDDDLPSIEPDADLYIKPLRRRSSSHIVQSLSASTPPRSRPASHGPYAPAARKERHNPIAQDLVDGSLIAVDGLDQEFQHRIEEPPRLLWVAIGQQRHRPLQVSQTAR